jgi:hypothetical protein
LGSLVKYFNCGTYFANPARDAGDFVVSSFSDIESKIVPFFNKYPLHGVKAQDFADFKRVMDLMKVKAHLTAEGLEQILKIKALARSPREGVPPSRRRAGMNTGRPF